MASISKPIPLDADADTVWAAVRDVGNAHHLFAGVLTDARLVDDHTRVVTFANGMVIHERILHLDDEARRLAYTVLDGPFSHHHATFSVTAEPDGTSTLTWVSYVLPDDAAPMVEGLMHQGALAARHALAARGDAGVMTVRLTIGEFSKMTYLSVKALRHYHDVGLLEPAEIDASSGYRHYSADQVVTAQAIRRFRELDMPLDQVRTVLQAPDLTTRNKAILDHLDAMQQQLERTHHTVASLQALLTTASAPRPVTYRSLTATPALARPATVAFDAATAWLDGAYAELHGALEAAGLSPDGPDGCLYHDAFFTEGEGDVLAYVPVAVDVATLGPVSTGGTQAIDLPATRVAAMLHEGTFDDLDQTYGALGTVVAELGLGIEGPIREIYLADDRAEVCWPITQAAAG